LSELSLIEDNKSQQKSTTHGKEDLGLRQQISTEINTIQQSQQKSAKSVPVPERSQQTSAIVSKSQHVSLWFVNSVQCSSEQTARIGT
jgi:hypothetical protein